MAGGADRAVDKDIEDLEHQAEDNLDNHKRLDTPGDNPAAGKVDIADRHPLAVDMDVDHNEGRLEARRCHGFGLHRCHRLLYQSSRFSFRIANSEI